MMLNTSYSNSSLSNLITFDEGDDQSIASFLQSLNKLRENDINDEYLTYNLTKAIDVINSFNQIERNDYKQKRDRLLRLLMIIQNLVGLNPRLATSVIIEKGFLSTYAKLLNYSLGFMNWDEDLLDKIFKTLCNLMKNEAIVNDFIKNNIMLWALEIFKRIDLLDDFLSADVKLADNRIFNLFFTLSMFFTTTLTFEGRKHLNRLCLTSFILRQLNFLKTKSVQQIERIQLLEIVKFNFAVIIVSLQNEYICEKLNVLNDDIVQNIVSMLCKTISISPMNTIEYKKTKFYYQINLPDTLAFNSAYVVLRKLKILTKIESIKEKLFNSKILGWLNILIEQGNDQEIELSCELMCSLCFNDKVTEYLRNNVNILESVKERLKNKTTNDLTKRYCNQILYLVHQGMVPGLISTLNNEKLSSYDIMISYHHTNVTICSEINQKLKEWSYSTWMDVKSNASYEKVTDAISKASIVVICYCEEYRNNINCRFEASFAVKYKKPIIFVRVQPNYEPDGWLHSIFNIKTKVDYLNNFRDLSCLHKYIESIRSNAYESPLVEKTPVTAALPFYTFSNNDVRTWTCDDTKVWFIENNFEKFIKNFPNCTGITLEIFCNQCGEYFTKVMSNKVKFLDLPLEFLELEYLYNKLDILFKPQPKKSDTSLSI